MKKTFGKILKIVLGLLAAFIWLVCVSLGGIAGVVAHSVCALWICRKIYKRAKGKEKELSGKFEDYDGAYAALSPKEITKILLHNEMDKMEAPVVARKSVQGRAIITAFYLVINFVCINCFYYKSSCAMVCAVLTIIYVFLLCKFSTLSVLFRYAAKHPNMTFQEIVREECTQEAVRKAKNLPVAGVALMAVSLVAFFAINNAPQWSISNGTVVRCRPSWRTVSQLEIPATHEGQPVMAVGESAFSDIATIESVVVPDSVRTIGKQAFANCKGLTQLKLSNSLESIGSGAFKGCENLEQITLPSTLVDLQGEAFMDCIALTAITIPEGVTEIRGNCFDGCTKLKEVTLHNGIVDIHAYAFQDCENLEQITLPESITEIHTYTFAGCSSLTEISIPSGVTKIAAHAFHGCSSLSEVSLPDTLLEIRSSAFRECSKLRSIAVPKGVSIDERAFKDSPTEVKEKKFSDAQWDQILQEIQDKEDPDVYYYLFRKDDPETIWTWSDDKVVVVIDDPRYREKLGENQGMGQLDGEEGLLAYLEAAKKEGLTKLHIARFSQLGTDITGKPYFVSVITTIEEIIQAFQETGE